MPGLIPQRRPRDVDDEEEEDDSLRGSQATPTSSKRARVSSVRANGVATAVAPSGEHQPGAIIRVALKDFVTYTSATFYPGPALNMVIGPNGTGKSTLVCALCLGLAASPNNLGRAKELGEFVKYGASDAFIEIELKARPGEPKGNPIIRTHIKREGNKRTFAINGTASTLKAVAKLCADYSIQIDNLCQFLPQDRVVEFASLSPVDLLASTQRAAAPQEMVDWHERLKELRVEQRAAEAQQEDVKRNLADLQRRQEAQRVDVERLRERGDLLQEISILEKLRPVARSAEIRLKHNEAKEKKAIAREELAVVKRETQPALEAVKVKKEYADAVKKALDSRAAIYKRTQGLATAVKGKQEKLEKDIKACADERHAENENEKKNRQNVAKFETQIRQVKARMNEEPIEFDLAFYQAQLRDFDRQLFELRDETAALNNARKERAGLAEERKRRITNAKQQQEALRTQAGQQANMLKRYAAESSRLYDFIKEHHDRFSAEVFGPPLIECHITDKNFLDAIETLLQKGDILEAFTVQNSQDFKLLNDILYNELKLTTISVRLADKSLDHYRQLRKERVMSDDMARDLGIEVWALDVLTGPEPVLSMMCQDKFIHEYPLLQRDDEAMYKSLSETNLRGWIAARSCYTITRRREYNAVSTNVKTLKQAEYWTTQPVDTRAQADLQDNIDGWTSELQEMQKQHKEDQAKGTALNERIASLTDEQTAMKEEKDAKQKAVMEYRALPTKLDGFEQKMAEIREAQKTLETRLSAISAKETALTLQKGQEAINNIRTLESIRSLHVDVVTAAVQHIEAQSDLQTLEQRNEEILQLLNEKQELYDRADKEVKGLTQHYKNVIAELTAALAADQVLSDHYNNMTEEERQRTTDELEGEIDSKQARLELLHEGDPTLINKFEERAAQIERMTARAASIVQELQAKGQSITEIRTRWEPRLDALVAQISDAFGASFAKINCAGEVTVFKAGDEGRDFENWAIQVQVRFREGEQMSILDSHRQSGGERAVSTIFYLMALQTLSRAPFRVVDEINQGMDPRNERIVHERMVDIACGNISVQQPDENGEGLVAADGHRAGGQSQYFLITPKLLTGLKYSPGMTVHCIASGEFMPDQKKAFTFKGYLQKKKALLRSGAGMATAAA